MKVRIIANLGIGYFTHRVIKFDLKEESYIKKRRTHVLFGCFKLSWWS